MIRFLAIVGLLSGLMCSAGLYADGEVRSGKYRAAVVELYTSEGCSSCPPADHFLAQLGQSREGSRIIPLAYHVDYWDYIGWKDPYASPEYTERQRQVARRNQQASIYTPEFVVDGREARGSLQIVEQINAAHSSLAEADIRLVYSSNEEGLINATVSVDRIDNREDDTPEIYLVLFENGLSSDIDAGENDGRTLHHDYVVRYASPAHVTTAGLQHPFEIKLDPKWEIPRLGIGAVVRLRESGRTLQAVKAKL